MPQTYCLFILALICSLVACTSPRTYGPYPPAPQSLEDIETWETELYPEPGKIQITGKVQQGSTAEIQLLDAQKKNFNIPARIIITDQDCDVGHQVILEYYSTANEILRKYFTTIIPLNGKFELTLEQHEKGDYTLTVNNEIMQFHRHYKALYLRLSGTDKGFTVSNFTYSKTEKN